VERDVIRGVAVVWMVQLPISSDEGEATDMKLKQDLCCTVRSAQFVVTRREHRPFSSQ
jgi:hypothetical protein